MSRRVMIMGRKRKEPWGVLELGVYWSWISICVLAWVYRGDISLSDRQKDTSHGRGRPYLRERTPRGPFRPLPTTANPKDDGTFVRIHSRILLLVVGQHQLRCKPYCDWIHEVVSVAVYPVPDTERKVYYKTLAYNARSMTWPWVIDDCSPMKWLCVDSYPPTHIIDLLSRIVHDWFVMNTSNPCLLYVNTLSSGSTLKDPGIYQTWLTPTKRRRKNFILPGLLHPTAIWSIQLETV